jgi:hypothetical protein
MEMMCLKSFHLIGRNKKFIQVEIKIYDGNKEEQFTHLVKMFNGNIPFQVVIVANKKHKDDDGRGSGNKGSGKEVWSENGTVPAGSGCNCK